MSVKCKTFSTLTDGSEPVGYKAGFYKGWDEAWKMTDDLVWITREELKYYSNLEAILDNMPISIDELLESVE